MTTEIFLRSGRADVNGLETGAWTVTVTADDGRAWTRRTQVAPGSTAHVILE